MALVDSIKGVRDYVVGVADATWAGTINKEDPAMVMSSLPSTRVVVNEVTFDAETVGTDAAKVTVIVAKRDALPGAASVSDAKIADGAAMRDALLADKTVGGHGYLPTVDSIQLSVDDPTDEFYEVAVQYSCLVKVAR